MCTELGTTACEMHITRDHVACAHPVPPHTLARSRAPSCADFYRVGVGIGLWWSFIAVDLFDLSAVLFDALLHRRPLHSEHTLPRLLGYAIFDRGLRAFAETLLAAIVLCICFWYACLGYWRVDMSHAAQMYLWGFVKDVFGYCAASGYKEAWGLDCLP